MRTVFYIHGDIIDKPVFDKARKPFGISAVRVEFYSKTERFNLFYKSFGIVRYQRFSARYGYAVKTVPATFEKRKKLFFGYIFTAVRAENERSVVAERTTEITSAEENCTGCLSGKIEESQFLKSGYFHLSSSFGIVYS